LPGSNAASGRLKGPLRRRLRLKAFWVFALLFASNAFGTVIVVPLEGAIGPASADFAKRAIERANREEALLVVLRIDTPGGLDTSMREIIKAILASKVPVAAFVAPSGARAASAGTFILYAAHIAAMAPGTNLGAASPVSIGGGGGAPQDKDDKKGSSGGDTMTRKVTNDAVAYIRGLAQLRGRNAEWAERAVREGVSLPAEEARKQKVIDIVAPDLPALLQALEGRKAGPGILKIKGTEVKQLEPDWRTKVLAVITNPSVAYILILVGIYALIFEFMNPGMILPGVVGAIALLLALYALHLLPVNYAGLALIVLGIAFMAAEAFLPAFGALGVGGLIAFVLGSIMLIDDDTELPGFEIPYALIGGLAVASAGFLVMLLGMFARQRRAAIVSGREFIIGARAEALEDFDGEGWAQVQGERWKVRTGAARVRRGQRLRVTAVNGLVLDAVPEGDEK
jgi:membrane-bound serine protease (ClpP class)